jgi:hypothetical protein
VQRQWLPTRPRRQGFKTPNLSASCHARNFPIAVSDLGAHMNSA